MTDAVWNGKNKVASRPTFAEVFPEDGSIGAAGLNYDLDLRVLRDEFGNVMPNVKGLYRTDINQGISVVGNRYQPIKNSLGAGVLAGFDREVVLDSRFSYENGAKVVMIMDCAESGIEIVKGDTHWMYLGLLLDHTGKGQNFVFGIDFRFACLNAMPAIRSGKRGRIINAVRHTGNVEFKIEQARQLLLEETAEVQRFRVWQQQLAEVAASKADILRVANILFPETETNQDGKGKTQRENKIAGLLSAVNVEQTLLPQWTTTSGGQNAYALFNGVTRLVDHGSSMSKASRPAYALLGGGLSLKQAGIDAIEEVFEIPMPVAA